MSNKKNQPQKEYECPHCGGKQDCVLQMLDVIETDEINVEAGDVMNTDSSSFEHRKWLCPRCENELSHDFVRKLKIGGD